MKKIYINPHMEIVATNLQACLLQDSLHINDIVVNDDAMVKEDVSSSRGYNVWDDDWSK